MNEPSGTFIRNIRPQFVIDALKHHRLYQLEEQAKAAGRWKDRGLVFANRCGGYVRHVTHDEIADAVG
jgi:hypothetical protein